MNQHRLTYRPEIDGLRAIAVVSVFIFHLNHSWLPGGFVGVDIFFVISGYLITSILYNDCILGKFSLARFYQRRVARIFPAYISVALATIAVTAFVYTSQDFSSTGVGLAAASLSLANMKFMLQGNYFEISPDSQPFLHYWSLSVEEQFYLIFPLLLFLIVRYAHRRVAMIIGFIGLVSLISSVTLTTINPVWAFYLLPTRAWELCAGSLLAVMPAAISDKRTISTIHLLPTIGLLLIGGSIILIPEGAGFPGWQAIFPVVGAVAIIVPQSNFKSRVFDWLSSTNMVRLGKMSYSLYLWHWPVFSIIDYQFYLQPELLRVVLKVGISLLLTVISYHFIIAAGIAGEVDMEVDQAGEQRLVAQVDDFGICGGSAAACGDRGDAIVGDDDRRCSLDRLIGGGDDPAGIDDGGFGVRRGAEQCQRERRNQSVSSHEVSPCPEPSSWRVAEVRARGKDAGAG